MLERLTSPLGSVCVKHREHLDNVRGVQEYIIVLQSRRRCLAIDQITLDVCLEHLKALAHNIFLSG